MFWTLIFLALTLIGFLVGAPAALAVSLVGVDGTRAGAAKASICGLILMVVAGIGFFVCLFFNL